MAIIRRTFSISTFCGMDWIELSMDADTRGAQDGGAHLPIKSCEMHPGGDGFSSVAIR